MVIELIGGPLDGALLDGSAQLSTYMIVTTHQEGPVYGARCCSNCNQARQLVPYYFLGYEENLSYEYPEKTKHIQALEQKIAVVQSVERRT